VNSTIVEIGTPISVLLTALQTYFAWRAQKRPSRKKVNNMPSESITISKQRAGWLTATIFVMCASSLGSIFYPRQEPFKPTPTDQLQRIENEQYVSETIDLDGKDFEDCTFVNVHFVLQGRTGFKIAHNRFSGSLTLSFGTMAGGQAATMVAAIASSAGIVKPGSIHFVNEHEGSVDIMIIPTPSPAANDQPPVHEQ
jgi:hypothetical protein